MIPEGLNICILSASHRDGSQSLRIAEHLRTHFLAGQASLIDLNRDRLPLWDGQPADESGEETAATVARLRATLNRADAFVLVVPEWHGMAPAGLKNFFLWFGAEELAHKPALLVSVSAGTGGAMVINELRANSYKNTRLNYLPEHLIFRDVRHLWTEDGQGDSDEYLEKRTKYALGLLITYTEALKPQRTALAAGLQDYPNGMS
ncbi:MAG: NAD(P)H-dependent oxidoreductase [Pseudomonadota bacterium]|nr:NAD(P)H-dependent oxidoreductase [Pseudomonadota bacterium]